MNGEDEIESGMCENCRACSMCDEKETDYYDKAGCWLCQSCAIADGLVDAVTALASIAPVGDCYETAARFLWDRADSELVLCHGWPTGQGPIGGICHGHAWIEETVELGGFKIVVVHDVSNGKSIEAMPAGWYYRLGQINPDDVQRYSREAANREMDRTGHFGPWVEQPEEVNRDRA
jgi:hypothetical protein